ncbi:MAG TPA: PAS domain S-box protein, partial [Chthonomonadales bacterium]|nr:PAS domain S-box protein [Chthonomonadales bacterium]
MSSDKSKRGGVRGAAPSSESRIAAAHRNYEAPQDDNHLAELIHAAADIIYRADRSGRFTFFNPTAVRMLGYSPDEILGRHYLDLIRPDFRRDAKRFYVKQFREKIPTTYFEYPVLASDGRTLWLGQHVQLVMRAGRITGVTAVARDITTRREAELQLAAANRDLERRVSQRTAELRTVNEWMEKEIAERQRLVERQRYFMRIAAAVNSSLDLDVVLRLVRDAVVQEGEFDRAGVFQVKGNTVRGSWGTDSEGRLRDEHYLVESLSEWGPHISDLASGRRRFAIEELGSDNLPEGVDRIPHVV